ncbi:metal-dependent transcriptional regulator [Parvicella tangerina]|uniref:Transcriptional regulator MntR n=1 Tax=Parvicella tangerina TaxID=2829795 RepID=A0A916JMW0_9FLAO|nr:metal-dependent transcriptional regulator [Parvicella tangerina]CAG5081115.1 HTH-type transcriptional regulator MntR [Parvicella tangerina]
MNSITEENYLKAMYTISEQTGDVAAVELSKHLNIKMPTVNSMMRKLAERGLVKYESYKPYQLTEEGKKQAALIIRKHRLTEMFLVEKMNFGWEEVHEIAEQVEHVKSPAFFEKMDQILGFPKLDPHGSPIPDKEGNIEWVSYRSLSDCEVGEQVHVVAVTNSSKEFLNFLNGKDVQLNIQVELIEKEPFDGSVKVRYKNREESFSKQVGDNLLVKKIS